MSSFLETVEDIQELLCSKVDWQKKYADYAKNLYDNESKIKNFAKKFLKWPPFRYYMRLGNAKEGNMVVAMRFKGQDVAFLKIKNDIVTISTKESDKSNKKYFHCPIELKDVSWAQDKKAQEFRKFFKDIEEESKSKEHKIESLLLKEFSKKESKNKPLLNIQPIKIANRFDFQFPTQINASDIIKYAPKRGGGIDILARIGVGGATSLCVIELKDENEPVSKVITQATAYATFLQALLRSKSGELWYKLFGFKREIPKNLKIYAVSLMPYKNEQPKEIKRLPIDKEGKDELILQSWYFKMDGEKISEILAP